jgi:hypothetical protein
MARIDEILSSVIKGAEEAGAKIEQRTVGREEKLAGIGGAAGSMLGPVGAAAGAGLQDKTWGGAAGAGAGAMLGGAGGAALGGMAGRSLGQLIDADPDLSKLVGQLIGGIGGGAMGGHMGQNAFRPDGKTASIPGVVGGGLLGGLGGGLGGAAAGMGTSALAGRMFGISPMQTEELAHVLGLAGGAIGGTGGMLAGAQAGRTPSQPEPEPGLLDKIRGKFSSAEDAYLAGSKEAAENFKIAFLPLLGMAASALAPMAARAGLSRIAGGALGKIGGGMLGRAAGGLASAAAKPVGGALFDMGVGSAASKMMPQQQ